MASFIEEAIGSEHLRVEDEFGHGFVRLKVSEAEKRQAAQDIRSSEDVVIELLRNSRDAGARNIFLATQRSGDTRSIVVIDDGGGIPESMHSLIFEPRVTSKLDTANMDRWGLHGRGMALFSISKNADRAYVVASEEGRGTSICVEVDAVRLGEKKDQSAFPRIEVADGKLTMRGPKNILRTAAEFALAYESSVNVHCGSFTEIAAALVSYGMATLSPASRAFSADDPDCELIQRPALASDPDQLASVLETLGLSLSARSCRRIMDGDIVAALPLMERIRAEVTPGGASLERGIARRPRTQRAHARISQDDLSAIAQAASEAFSHIAGAYYLDAEVPPKASVRNGAVHIELPLIERP